MSGLSPVPRIPKRPSTRNGIEAASATTTATATPGAMPLSGGPVRATTQTSDASAMTPIAIADAVPSPGSRTVPHATAVTIPRPTAGASHDHRRAPQTANSPCPMTHEAARMSANDPYVASIGRRA